MTHSGLLDGKQEIMDFLKCSEHKLLKYVGMGMPVLNDDGRWLAHRDNIDSWFKFITRLTEQDNSKKKPVKTPVK